MLDKQCPGEGRRREGSDFCPRQTPPWCHSAHGTRSSQGPCWQRGGLGLGAALRRQAASPPHPTASPARSRLQVSPRHPAPVPSLRPLRRPLHPPGAPCRAKPLHAPRDPPTFVPWWGTKPLGTAQPVLAGATCATLVPGGATPAGPPVPRAVRVPAAPSTGCACALGGQQVSGHGQGPAASRYGGQGPGGDGQ